VHKCGWHGPEPSQYSSNAAEHNVSVFSYSCFYSAYIPVSLFAILFMYLLCLHSCLFTRCIIHVTTPSTLLSLFVILFMYLLCLHYCYIIVSFRHIIHVSTPSIFLCLYPRLHSCLFTHYDVQIYSSLHSCLLPLYVFLSLLLRY
jgi:hypothetical protein